MFTLSTTLILANWTELNWTHSLTHKHIQLHILVQMAMFGSSGIICVPQRFHTRHRRRRRWAGGGTCRQISDNGARGVQHKFAKAPLKSAGNFYHWNVITSYQCLLVYHCNYVIFWISLNREFKCLFIYIMGHKKQDNIFYSDDQILTDYGTFYIIKTQNNVQFKQLCIVHVITVRN